MKTNDLTEDTLKELKSGKYVIFDGEELITIVNFNLRYYPNRPFSEGDFSDSLEEFKLNNTDCEMFPIKEVKKPSEYRNFQISQIAVNELDNINLINLKGGYYKIDNSEIIEFGFYPAREIGKQAVFTINNEKKDVEFIKEKFKDCVLVNINTQCIGEEGVGCSLCPPYCYGE